MQRRRPVLTVAIEAQGEEAAPHVMALASLPLHFSPVDAGGGADVRVVAGTPEVWPALAEAALEREPRAVVVARRSLAVDAHASRLMMRASSAGVVVAVATPFAGTRSWRAAQDRLRREASSASVVDSVMEWAGLDEQAAIGALLDQLAVISAIVPEISGLRVGRAAPGHYLVAGMAARIAVVLSGSRFLDDAPRLQVDVAGTRSRWRLCFDGAAPARPAIIERYSEGLIATQPMRFESGYRGTWIDLYQHLARGVPVPDYLAVDQHHLALAGRLAAAIAAD